MDLIAIANQLLGLIHGQAQLISLLTLSVYFVADAVLKASLSKRAGVFEPKYLPGFLRKYVEVLVPFAIFAVLSLVNPAIAAVYFAAVALYTASEISDLLSAFKAAFTPNGLIAPPGGVLSVDETGPPQG